MYISVAYSSGNHSNSYSLDLSHLFVCLFGWLFIPFILFPSLPASF